MCVYANKPQPRTSIHPQLAANEDGQWEEGERSVCAGDGQAVSELVPAAGCIMHERKHVYLSVNIPAECRVGGCG